MEKIIAALVLLAVTVPTSATGAGLPPKFQGEWCAVEKSAKSIDGTNVYIRETRSRCKDVDRWMSLDAKGMYAHDLRCKLIGAHFIAKYGAHFAQFSCVGDAKEARIVKFRMALDKQGQLTMEETERPPME